MDNVRDAIQRSTDIVFSANVAYDEVNPSGYVPRESGAKVVENANLFASGNQLLDDVRANEACAACDKKHDVPRSMK
jgi:hypothetical protein